MGELKKSSAESKRGDYVEDLQSAKKKVRENFDEMDFQNAVQRDQIEDAIAGIEAELDAMIKTLNDMSFE